MANLKNTTISDSGFIQLPKGTTSERPNNPETGMMRWNTETESVEFFDGANWDTINQREPSGIHYYNIPTAGNNIIEYYRLPEPFDLDNKGSPFTLDTGERNDVMDISNDGRFFWTLGDNGSSSTIKQWNLSVPFDLTTASQAGTIPYPFDPDPPICFEFVLNGRRLFLENDGELIQYDLTVPYDISTRTETGSLGGFPGSGAGDPAFSPDGTQVAIGERSGQDIISGTCSTPFDISTFSQQATFDPPNGDPSCCKWNANGTILYTRHASPDMVNEYVTPNPYSVSGMSFNRQIYNNPGFAGGGHEFNYNY